MTNWKPGDVVWVNFPDTHGRLIFKCRPAIIMFRATRLGLVSVVPLTRWKDDRTLDSDQILVWPSEVNKLRFPSLALLDQLGPIDSTWIMTQPGEAGSIEEEILNEISERWIERLEEVRLL